MRSNADIAPRWRQFMSLARIALVALIGVVVAGAAPGCGMFQQRQKRPEKTGPLTVEDWMGQKRLTP